VNRQNEPFLLTEATISSVHEAMRNQGLTCRKLIEMYLDRINQYDKTGPSINSVISLNPRALQEADELDRRFNESGLTGPLHGIPVLLKDNIGTCDMPTTDGSVILAENVPSEDAFVTRKLKEAGAIILAKMNLHELAFGGETVSSLLGQTRNPYDLTRTPGGSSGGSAAGIAMNFGIIGIGTDTINSVRSPASACNLVGFRPTFGLVSRNGVFPSSRTQDTIGPITRTVADAATVLTVISGYDATDSETELSIGHVTEPFESFVNIGKLKGKRIGVLRSFFGSDEIHQAVNVVIQRCLFDMQQEGAVLIEIVEDLDAAKLQKEMSADLHEFKTALNDYLGKLGPLAMVHSLSEIIATGKYYKGIETNLKIAEMLGMNTAEYDDRLMKRSCLRERVIQMMVKNDLDVIVFPHQKRPVVKIGDSQVERNGILGALTGFPSCVVPAGFTTPTDTAPLGIPVGIEFFAQEWNEAKLLEIVYSFEQVTQHRRAPVFK
jgi:amidase